MPQDRWPAGSPGGTGGEFKPGGAAAAGGGTRSLDPASPKVSPVVRPPNPYSRGTRPTAEQIAASSQWRTTPAIEFEKGIDWARAKFTAREHPPDSVFEGALAQMPTTPEWKYAKRFIHSYTGDGNGVHRLIRQIQYDAVQRTSLNPVGRARGNAARAGRSKYLSLESDRAFWHGAAAYTGSVREHHPQGQPLAQFKETIRQREALLKAWLAHHGEGKAPAVEVKILRAAWQEQLAEAEALAREMAKSGE